MNAHLDEPSSLTGHGHLKVENNNSDADTESNGTNELGSPESPATPVNLQTVQKCGFMSNCELDSPDRRVVSHYFGRNKKETRAMPDFVWVVYCRRHYQRHKYRQKAGSFAETQMGLVRKTVENLRKWGGVTGFDLSLRKRAMDQIAKEDKHAREVEDAIANNRLPPQSPSTSACRERVLVPHIGKNKSYAEIYDFIDMVSKKCTEEHVEAFEFEIIPIFKPDFITKKTPTRRTPAKRNATSPLPGSSSPMVRRR